MSQSRSRSQSLRKGGRRPCGSPKATPAIGVWPPPLLLDHPHPSRAARRAARVPLPLDVRQGYPCRTSSPFGGEHV